LLAAADDYGGDEDYSRFVVGGTETPSGWGMKIAALEDTTTPESTERRPRIIVSSKTENAVHNRRKIGQQATKKPAESTTTESIFSGQYIEANTPTEAIFSGKYMEVNPGQYHEVNPGQYHEVNPGQYSEVNPGQYHEVNPGQYHSHDLEVDDVTVDFANREHTQIYNVKAKAGDFIIGEVGKINVNNGQTLEGVRYTALDGFLDQRQISDLLNRYFGAQTS